MCRAFSRLSALLAVLHRKLRSEAGNSLVEYALLVVLIALICVSAVTFLGDTTCSNLSEIPETAFGTASNASC